MSGKPRPKNNPGKGRTPTYARPAAVAARAQAPVFTPPPPPVRAAPRAPRPAPRPPNRPPARAVPQVNFQSASSAPAAQHAAHEVKINKPAMSPWRGSHGKYALGAGAAVGGTAFLYHRGRTLDRRGKTVAKYFDPFSGDVVEFQDVSKAGGGVTAGFRVARTAARSGGSGHTADSRAFMFRGMNRRQKAGVKLHGVSEHVSDHRGKYGVGAAFAGAGALDARNNVKTYREARDGRPVGALRRTYYPLAFNAGDKKRQERVGKAFASNAFANQPVTRVAALVPTGNHIGRGQNLLHVHNSKGGGGRATSLQHFHNGSGGGGRATKLGHWSKR